MSYVKKTWSEITPILPDDLNNIEDGIYNNFNDISSEINRAKLVEEQLDDKITNYKIHKLRCWFNF